ncbi:C' protein [Walkabout Creek virus]|uniref:C' protein n=1 Tax=Walkabout Creek virus TaxID=1569258 RepID=A0A0A0V3A1_9RHAB|nr:C' protein [Walkabout Creek virus]AIW61113.1 C' protein [Walkabout Creek virus]
MNPTQVRTVLETLNQCHNWNCQEESHGNHLLNWWNSCKNLTALMLERVMSLIHGLQTRFIMILLSTQRGKNAAIELTKMIVERTLTPAAEPESSTSKDMKME